MNDDSTAGKAKKYGKKVAISIAGGIILFIGIVMLVTPGPAFILIPAGLAILAIEFIWARRLLKKAKDFIKEKTRGKGAEKPPPAV